MLAVDARGRIVDPGPHFHVLRTDDQVVCRSHARLPDAAAAALEAIAHRPRGRQRDWPRDYGDYLRVLVEVAPLRAARAGLLYAALGRAGPEPAGGDEAITVTEDNANLLHGGLDEWRPDVAAGLPMCVAVADGRAVAICASVQASARAHDAGVETLPAYRGRGLASKAVAAWARLVRAHGAVPLYGTTFDKLGSQGVARRLGLTLIGSEFSVALDFG